MRSLRFVAAATAVGAIALVGCSSGGDTTATTQSPEEGETVVVEEPESGDLDVLVIGASPSPHARILEFVNDNLAEEAGLKLDIVVYSDYIQPNEALQAGELDLNYFQTVPYLEDQIAERGYDFEPGEPIHLEPLAIYSDRYETIEEVPDGATIGIISDPTNQGRALKLLADQGFVELPEEGTVNITTVTPLRDVSFVEVEGPSLTRNLTDVDIAVINGNFAIEGGLSPAEDALAVESIENNPASNLLVWPVGTDKKDAILKLQDLLRSDETRTFIEETWSDGSVIPSF